MTETYTAEVTVPDLFEAVSYGLVDAVTWIPGDAAGHWRGGIQWDVECPDAATTKSGCFPGIVEQAPQTKSVTWEHLTRGARPFTVYDRMDCSTPGQGTSRADLDMTRDSALRALAQSAPRTVEETFWTGTTSPYVYPNLSRTSEVLDPSGLILLQPSAVVPTGTRDVTEALGILEEAMAGCYGGKAWIHVPAILGPALASRGLVVDRNGKLFTTGNGSRVIIGNGYGATHGPDGATNAAGVTQMWATSPVFGIKGQPTTFDTIEMLDRDTNTLQVIAEQTYLLGWHCCHFGVNVSTGGTVAGTVASAS